MIVGWFDDFRIFVAGIKERSRSDLEQRDLEDLVSLVGSPKNN